MAGKINNLFEIISAPGLEDSKYGEHINAQFNNINENFAALANREFVQGPDGQGVNVVEIKFVGSNLTTQSPYITISKDLEASIKAAFETYNPDNQDWYKDITCSAYLDSDEKLHSIYPIIYSEVVEDIFNDDDVTESTTKSDFRSLQFDYDESGKLCLTKYDQNFPSIEYNQEVGDFCWVLNGKVTEITARGPQGERGEDADSFDTLIVNQEPISKDSDLHEITHIYVDGALRELTPQIKTPADILWYNKFRQVWINNNIDKIFITAGPSKTESEAKTINYFGKMIKHKKSTQNTQSDNTQSDNTPAQKATVLTSKRPSIIIGVNPGVIIDKTDAAGAIDKIIDAGGMAQDAKDYIDNHKDTIASQIVQASSTVYCMKLSPGTVFNMSMMAQTTTGTLYDELSGTYPGTDKGSTQALFLWDGKNKEAYTLQKPGDGLVIGHIDDYEKCQRASASSADLKPDPLMTIQNGGTTLKGTLAVDGTTTLNGGLTVKEGQNTTLEGTLKVNGATQLNGNLTVAKDKATTLNGTLEVNGATQLNGELNVNGGNAIITPKNFRDYFGIKSDDVKIRKYLTTHMESMYSCPNNVCIINFPQYIQYVINKSSSLSDKLPTIHYIGSDFNFYITYKNNLSYDSYKVYKVYGDINFNIQGMKVDSYALDFEWFSLDCYFLVRKKQDVDAEGKPKVDANGDPVMKGIVEIPYCSDINGPLLISADKANKYSVGVCKWVRTYNGTPVEIQLVDNVGSPEHVIGGIGIYKKDSFLDNPLLVEVLLGEMPTGDQGGASKKSPEETVSDQFKPSINIGGKEVVDFGVVGDGGLLTPMEPTTNNNTSSPIYLRRVAQTTLPYWATWLSSDCKEVGSNPGT